MTFFPFYNIYGFYKSTSRFDIDLTTYLYLATLNSLLGIWPSRSLYARRLPIDVKSGVKFQLEAMIKKLHTLVLPKLPTSCLFSKTISHVSQDTYMSFRFSRFESESGMVPLRLFSLKILLMFTKYNFKQGKYQSYNRLFYIAQWWQHLQSLKLGELAKRRWYSSGQKIIVQE